MKLHENRKILKIWSAEAAEASSFISFELGWIFNILQCPKAGGEDMQI